MSEHADRVLSAIEAADDSSAIVASWRRCRHLHKLHPDENRMPERDLAGWRLACERDARMVGVARPFVDELFRLLNEVDCCVHLADRTGMMLSIRTNRVCDSFGRRFEECIGVTYGESVSGTNSIGTAVADKRGMVLRGRSHFLTRYIDYACLSAPIHGPDGEFVGCLAVNHHVAAHEPRLDPFISISLANFAQRIERELFAQAFPKARIVLASPLAGRADALLAIDADHFVLGATHAARRLLVPLGGPPDLYGIGLEQLLDEQTPAQLADTERRAIERALARFGGNVSAAAKAMGISRSTLYRKMARYTVHADQPAVEARRHAGRCWA